MNKMTKETFRKIQKQISVVLNKIEKEALDNGEVIASPEFQELLGELRKKMLGSFGLSLEEYEKLRKEYSPGGKSVAEIMGEMALGKGGVQKLDDLEVHLNELSGLFEDFKTNVKKYRGEKGDSGKDGKDGKNGRDGRDGIDGKDGRDGIDGIDGKDGKSSFLFSKNKLKQEIMNQLMDVKSEFMKNLMKNINILGMPDWRKAIMGLQGQIDGMNSSGNLSDLGFAPEDLSSQCNGSETVFSTSREVHSIISVILGGATLLEGKEVSISGTKEITLTFSPESGEELYIKYI